MPSHNYPNDERSKKDRGSASSQRNKLLLIGGLITILLLTAIYQLTALNGAATTHPKFLEKYQNELKRTQEMQNIVRKHIADIENAKATGAHSNEAHEAELAEKHGEIAELSKSIHDLQAKYAKLVVESSKDVNAKANAGAQNAAAKALAEKAKSALRGGDGHGPGGRSDLIPEAAGGAPASPVASKPSASIGQGGKVPPNGNAHVAIDNDPEVHKIQADRAAQIRDAIAFVWKNYKAHAWGQDNLNPISGRGRSAGFNHAVTLIDSLDTLWIAGQLMWQREG